MLDDPSVLAGLGTAEAIQQYLKSEKRGNSYAFYKLFREYKKSTSYTSCRRYFWLLKEIGLIRVVGTEPGKHGLRKRMYAITPGKEDDPAWWHCQGELYKAASIGRGYSEPKAQGKRARQQGGIRSTYSCALYYHSDRSRPMPYTFPALPSIFLLIQHLS